MSRKLKVGEKVIINETGETGVIKSREMVMLASDNVDVQYIVKTGEGFDKWKACHKKDLSVIPEKIEKNKYPIYIYRDYELADGRKLVLCGVIYRIITKSFEIGHSICHPIEAEFNMKIGKSIAKRRVLINPIERIHIMTGSFSEDDAIALMDAKAKYIEKNIDRFIGLTTVNYNFKKN